MSKVLTIHRRAHFNAAHQLARPDWSEEQNVEVFGKCSNPNFHGHNYELVVSLTGKISPETGFVMNLSELKMILKEDIIDYLDHKNLNIEIPEFQVNNGGLIPTAENICIVIWERLRKKISPDLQLSVRLYETARNFVDYSGH